MSQHSDYGDGQMMADHNPQFTEEAMKEFTDDGARMNLAIRRICLHALKYATEEFGIADLVTPIAPEQGSLWVMDRGGMKFFVDGPENTNFGTGATVGFYWGNGDDLGEQHVKIYHPSHLVRHQQWNEYDMRARDQEEDDGSLPWVVVKVHGYLEENWRMLIETPPREGDFVVPRRRPVSTKYKGALS